MSQSAASAAPSRKKAVFSLLVLAGTHRHHRAACSRINWAEITAALSQLILHGRCWWCWRIGISYPLLEGCVAWVIVRSRHARASGCWQGIDTAWCGTFGNVVTLGAGAVPVQTWYLHRLRPGRLARAWA